MSNETIAILMQGAIVGGSLMIAGYVLVFIFSLIKKVFLKSSTAINEKVNSDDSLVKAVYNHSKDIAKEIKPKVEEYKQKHQNSQHNKDNLNEDKIYEEIMIEIEENKKNKSTWAKALSQSDGDKDKAESLYIKFRFEMMNKNSIKRNDNNEVINKEKGNELNSNIEIKQKENIEKSVIKESNLELLKKMAELKGYVFVSDTEITKESTWEDFTWQISDQDTTVLYIMDREYIIETLVLEINCSYCGKKNIFNNDNKCISCGKNIIEHNKEEYSDSFLRAREEWLKDYNKRHDNQQQKVSKDHHINLNKQVLLEFPLNNNEVSFLSKYGYKDVLSSNIILDSSHIKIFTEDGIKTYQR